jgi:Leucine-rich repeat (LRR) protein
MDAIITRGLSAVGSTSVTLLHSINISGNALTEVPFLIPFKMLNNVDLSNNSLTMINPSQLPNSIQFFNATHNPVTTIDFSSANGFLDSDAFVNL